MKYINLQLPDTYKEPLEKLKEQYKKETFANYSDRTVTEHALREAMEKRGIRIDD